MDRGGWWVQSMGSLAQKCIEVRVLKLGQDIKMKYRSLEFSIEE